MDTETLHRVYTNLMAQREMLHDATEDAITARRNYETIKADGLMLGDIQGKNDLERDAKARNTYHNQYIHMLNCEQRERLEKRNYDMAALEVELARALLRLAEIEARDEK